MSLDEARTMDGTDIADVDGTEAAAAAAAVEEAEGAAADDAAGSRRRRRRLGRRKRRTPPPHDHPSRTQPSLTGKEGFIFLLLRASFKDQRRGSFARTGCRSSSRVAGGRWKIDGVDMAILRPLQKRRHPLRWFDHQRRWMSRSSAGGSSICRRRFEDQRRGCFCAIDAGRPGRAGRFEGQPR